MIPVLFLVLTDRNISCPIKGYKSAGFTRKCIDIFPY